ncbi:putative immunoglobulin-blocking virulence protein [Mycoplasma phocoeninasale]|uniref:Putative immunoglobulin-blocking virulence protein n=1 Tax=Mycoplasma phocoeninasale TaxID=2726117 RepID=A0A858U2I8_9MOLU|nr:putative immunoglobulin-blocking virulence protein [Mycoplasma phocoeninasale]QJG66690.1 putative immunoglobulin-blocking virulence protein [Mycoplasma phocoeninasale]
MSFLKKRKNRILLGVIVATVTTSVAIGAGLYFLNSDSKRNNFTSISSSEINAQLINKENLDIQNASQSINDNNLKQIEIPPKIVPKEEKIIVAPDIRKPEVKKDEKPKEKEEKQTPKPIVEKIETDKFKPPKLDAEDLNDSEETYITFSGLKVKVRIRKPGRLIDPKYKHLANREPYLNNIVGKILYVEVTEELRQKNRSNAQSSLKSNVHPEILKEFKTGQEKDIKAVIRQNRATQYYINLFDKYKRLFDNGDKVKEFLTPHGMSIYDKDIKQKYIDEVNRLQEEKRKKKIEFEEYIKNKPQERDKNGEYTEEFNKYSKRFEEFDLEIKEIDDKIQDAKDYKYSQLIANLDYSKFTKTSDRLDNDLHQGLVISPNEPNVYINADGTLDSYAQSPLLNEVTSRNERDNSQKRAFGIPGYFGRSPDSVNEGSYEGWNREDVTKTQEFQFLHIQDDEGIKIHKLTKKADSKVETKRNVGYVVTIDASNRKGYAKTLKLIQDLIKNKKEITSYRIKNIGLTDNNQAFYEIFQALPEKLPQLELFFEGSNTSALLALENKLIDELSIYTTGNSLADHWSINPYALKNVAWVNNLDYNVSFDYPKNARITSRITFDSISFDESDFKQGLNRINEGLKIAYWIRNNEPIFQGGLGPGLDPDNNEKGNSYPVGLDLTRVPSMKSLKGLEFKKESTDPDSSKRRLKRIGLFNDDTIFTIDVSDLNEGQFDILDTNPMAQPRSKIYFSNGNRTRRIHLTNKNNINLNSSGKSNLNILLNYSPDNFSRSTNIEIDKNDAKLVSDLSGFSVTEFVGIQLA